MRNTSSCNFHQPKSRVLVSWHELTTFPPCIWAVVLQRYIVDPVVVPTSTRLCMNSTIVCSHDPSQMGTCHEHKYNHVMRELTRPCPNEFHHSGSTRPQLDREPIVNIGTTVCRTLSHDPIHTNSTVAGSRNPNRMVNTRLQQFVALWPWLYPCKFHPKWSSAKVQEEMETWQERRK